MKNEPIPNEIEVIEELEQIIAPQSSSGFMDRKKNLFVLGFMD